MTYVTNDGALVSGATATDVVADLRRQSRSPEASLEAWRIAAAGYALTQTGKRVRPDSDDVFVSDLLEIGLLREIVAH